MLLLTVLCNNSLSFLSPATFAYLPGIWISALLNLLYVESSATNELRSLSRSCCNPSFSRSNSAYANAFVYRSIYILEPYTIIASWVAANAFILIALWILPNKSDKYDCFCSQFNSDCMTLWIILNKESASADIMIESNSWEPGSLKNMLSIDFCWLLYVISLERILFKIAIYF